MARFRLSPAAEKDIEEILRWTHHEFGEQIRIRYEKLLVQAILDLADDLNRAGSHARPELAKMARFYHLQSSRDHVARSRVRIRKPRHFLIYRVGKQGEIEVARVLHDSIDLMAHLPDDYRADRSESGS